MNWETTLSDFGVVGDEWESEITTLVEFEPSMYTSSSYVFITTN